MFPDSKCAVFRKIQWSVLLFGIRLPLYIDFVHRGLEIMMLLPPVQDMCSFVLNRPREVGE